LSILSLLTGDDVQSSVSPWQEKICTSTILTIVKKRGGLTSPPLFLTAVHGHATAKNFIYYFNQPN
jgi:hypothetical protein